MRSSSPLGWLVYSSRIWWWYCEYGWYICRNEFPTLSEESLRSSRGKTEVHMENWGGKSDLLTLRGTCISSSWLWRRERKSIAYNCLGYWYRKACISIQWMDEKVETHAISITHCLDRIIDSEIFLQRLKRNSLYPCMYLFDTRI